MPIVRRPGLAAIPLLLSLWAIPALAQDTAIGHFNAGVRNHRKGDYRAAIEEFNKAIALKPDYWKAYTSRGGGEER